MPFGFHYDLLKQPFSAAISLFIETAQLIKVHSGAAVMTENDSFFISVSAGSFFFFFFLKGLRKTFSSCS